MKVQNVAFNKDVIRNKSEIILEYIYIGVFYYSPSSLVATRDGEAAS